MQKNYTIQRERLAAGQAWRGDLEVVSEKAPRGGAERLSQEPMKQNSTQNEPCERTTTARWRVSEDKTMDTITRVGCTEEKRECATNTK